MCESCQIALGTGLCRHYSVLHCAINREDDINRVNLVTYNDVNGYVCSMEYYQPRFWGLDPLFSAKAKLSVGDVLTLQEYPDFPGTEETA